MESLQNRRLIGLFLFVLLAAAGAVFWLYPPDAEENGLDIDSSVYINLEDVKLVQGAAGRQKWELTAKSSKYFREEKRIRVYRPNFNFFMQNSTARISMNAPIGEANPEKSEIRLWKGVAANYSGSRMTAETMHYIGKKERIEFQGGVRLSQRGYLVKSANASLNLERQELSFEGNVEVYFGKDL